MNKVVCSVRYLDLINWELEMFHHTTEYCCLSIACFECAAFASCSRPIRLHGQTGLFPICTGHVYQCFVCGMGEGKLPCSLSFVWW